MRLALHCLSPTFSGRLVAHLPKPVHARANELLRMSAFSAEDLREAHVSLGAQRKIREMYDMQRNTDTVPKVGSSWITENSDSRNVHDVRSAYPPPCRGRGARAASGGRIATLRPPFGHYTAAAGHGSRLSCRVHRGGRAHGLGSEHGRCRARGSDLVRDLSN